MSAAECSSPRTVQIIPIKFYDPSYFPHHARRQIMSCVPKERRGINIFVGGRGGHGGTNLDVHVDLKFPFPGK